MEFCGAAVRYPYVHMDQSRIPYGMGWIKAGNGYNITKRKGHNKKQPSRPGYAAGHL